MDGLGHIELGTSSRPPLVFFHGYPAAARQATAVPDLGVFDGFRLVAIDRPGFGDSAPAGDGAELTARFRQLLERLGISTFHIVAVSAGAATAFLLADRLRERVMSLTSISSLGPLDERELFNSLPRMVRSIFTLARYSPWLLAKLFDWRLKAFAPEQKASQPRYLAAILSPRDRAALLDPRIQRALCATRLSAFKQGALTVAREARRMQQHWPIGEWRFPFPVRLFHGSADQLVPPVHAEWLARRIEGSQLAIIADEGHYSLPMLRLAEILAGIG